MDSQLTGGLKPPRCPFDRRCQSELRPDETIAVDVSRPSRKPPPATPLTVLTGRFNRDAGACDSELRDQTARRTDRLMHVQHVAARDVRPGRSAALGTRGGEPSSLHRQAGIVSCHIGSRVENRPIAAVPVASAGWLLLGHGPGESSSRRMTAAASIGRRCRRRAERDDVVFAPGGAATHWCVR
jgi:hypothetical protein